MVGDETPIHGTTATEAAIDLSYLSHRLQTVLNRVEGLLAKVEDDYRRAVDLGPEQVARTVKRAEQSDERLEIHHREHEAKGHDRERPRPPPSVSSEATGPSITNTALTAATLQSIRRRPRSATRATTTSTPFERAMSSRRRERNVVTPSVLISASQRLGEISLSDQYLDRLVERHAPHLALATEEARAARRFFSVGDWNAHISSRSHMPSTSLRSYLTAAMSADAARNGEHNQGLSETALAALGAFTVKEKLGDRCCICLDEVEAGQRAIILPCTHGFHRGCIIRWLTKQNICPLCKSDVSY